MQILIEPNANFFTFQVNRATYKIQTIFYCVEEGESGKHLNGGGGRHREGADARCRPSGGRGSGQRGVEADVEERAHSVDQTTVGAALRFL
jgi:hypothetical protein